MRNGTGSQWRISRWRGMTWSYFFLLQMSLAPALNIDYSRPPSRRISRRPEKLFYLAAGKIAASRQPGRKINAAKTPPNVRLKAALPRDVNEKLTSTVQGSYDQPR